MIIRARRQQNSSVIKGDIQDNSWQYPLKNLFLYSHLQPSQQQRENINLCDISYQPRALSAIFLHQFNNTTQMSNSREKGHSRDKDAIKLLANIKRDSNSIGSQAGNLHSENKSRKKIQARSLIKDIEKIEQQKKREEAKSKYETTQTQKTIKLDLMKLKDKEFVLDKNIYNIAIGEVASRQAYISSLHEQIAALKNKISMLQYEELSRLAAKSIEDPLRISVDSAINQQQKRPICGRFYSKDSSPIFNRRSKPNNLIDKDSSQIVREPFPKSIEIIKDERKTGQAPVKRQSEEKIHIEVHLASKETKKNQLRIDKTNGEQPIEKRVQTESQNVRILSQYRIKQKSNKHIIDIGLQDEVTQIGLIQRTEPKIEMNRKITDEIGNQIDETENYVVNVVKVDEDSSPIFVEDPSWEITSIHDDFRLKIDQKLQIPSHFPPPSPDPTDTLEFFQIQAAEIYKLFNIDIKKYRQKVIASKFKNGVFYQLKPSKNIVRYFDGSFYLGQWDNEAPNGLEKKGVSFEYVPNKYYYLGRFNNGNRSGRGVIKIISNKGRGFMGYDGEWMNGKPHGFGKHIDDQGNKYIGNFEQGEKTGKAVMVAKNGQSYEGEVRKGLKHGQGIEKQINGDVYIGSFSEGKYHGVGTYKWKNGSIFEGPFVMGQRQGKGFWRSFNGDTFEGEYKNDLKHGWGKFTWNNGQIYEGQFENDIRNGQGSYKHPKGKVAKYIWKDGHIDRKLEQKTAQTVKQE